MIIKSYFKHFTCENKSKKNKKIFVNKIEDLPLLLQYNFTIKELKKIIKKFNLPKCGSQKKEDLFIFVVNCFYLYHKTNKIQKLWRNYFIKQFNKTLGPAYFNRSISNNVEDCITTEDIKDIDYYNFFSYKDKDGFVYSFNILSIYNLVIKRILKNPYNRIEFDSDLINLIIKRQKMNIIMKKGEQFIVSTQTQPISLQQRITNLFHKIYELGNYSEHIWFVQLRRHDLCKFLFELYEIWVYRAQLTREIQILICPPNGNPFMNVNPNYISYLERTQPMRYIQSIALDIMEKMVFRANIESNQNLGALYILSALTLVSESARLSLPWLYASVQYN